MDLNSQFIVENSRHYVESRMASARQYRYGNGSPAASMIASIAAAIRKAAANVERWARGANVEVTEHRLPRLNSAR